MTILWWSSRRRPSGTANAPCMLVVRFSRRKHCLRGGWHDAPEDVVEGRDVGCLSARRRARMSVTWLNSPLALFERVQRHGHDEIPVPPVQDRGGFAEQQPGEKVFKPGMARIFETVNGFAHGGLGDDGRAGVTKMKFQLATVGAFKAGGQFAGERQAAASAKGRADEVNLGPALGTDEAVNARGGALLVAQLADFGVNQSQKPASSQFRRLPTIRGMFAIIQKSEARSQNERFQVPSARCQVPGGASPIPLRILRVLRATPHNWVQRHTGFALTPFPVPIGF